MKKDDGSWDVHPIYYSLIHDIFRKLDGNGKMLLDADDVVSLRSITKAKCLEGMDQDYFLSFFKGYSWNSDKMVTEKGFTEFMTDLAFDDEEDFMRIVHRMGYDDDLFSFKSWNFVMSFHFTESFEVSLGDNTWD